MDQINEALDRLSELSDDELGTLEGSILSEFDALEGGDVTKESVASMTRLADALDTVRGEIGTRAEAAQELLSAKEAAASRISAHRPAADETTPVDPTDDTTGADVPDLEEINNADAPTQTPDGAMDPDAADGDVVANDTVEADTDPESADAVPSASDPDPDGDGDDDTSAETDTDNSHFNEDGTPKKGTNTASLETPEAAEAASKDEPKSDDKASEDAPSEDENDDAATEADAETDNKNKEQPVTASGAEPDITPPADRLPATVSTPGTDVPVVITAGADIPGVPAGSELPDMLSVASGMVQRMHSMRRTSGGDGEQHIVASLQSAYPEERTLRSTQIELNDEKIRAVTSPEALVAAGGLCAPVNVRYDLFGLGQLDRPVKDALVPFTADRGGIRYITPPKLADFSSSVALWTVQDDIDASTPGAPDPVKPCVRINCGTEVVVLLEAITLCLTFGNMSARAYPEMVKRNNELGLIQHARFAETRLLTRIGTLSTSVSAAHVIGAARDFFVQLSNASSAYRSRHRMAHDDKLHVILPQWFLGMIRSDLTMNMPGNGSDETIGASDALINQWFAVRNINVSWHMDGETGQIFGAQAGGTGTLPNTGFNTADTATYSGVQALSGYPSTMVWYLFAEGSFLFLDGGTLDLGLVRDSTLNGTNDYKMFIETFEGVAMVGVESLRVSSNLVVTGGVAGTVATN